MTRQTYIATDAGKCAILEYDVTPILRRDRLGNSAGGMDVRVRRDGKLMLFEGGREITLCFEQAEGRRFVEDLAAKFGARKVEWGLERQESSQ